jgi:hypothetical protein
MLTRLIYASESTAALAPASLQALLDHARAANERRNITGMLAFDSRCFLQVLEGDRQAVNQVFSRIAADPRHRRVELLEMVTVQERAFAKWSMAFAAADAAGKEIFLRFGLEPIFNPYAMTGPAAVALLAALG